jgi:hypothetical protein
MKPINLPALPKGKRVITCPTTVSKWCGVPQRGFTVQEVEFSLEEASSIEGFLGYVVVEDQKHQLRTSPVNLDKSNRPLPIVGVCFVQ